VTVGGETGREARICDYEWILYIREQCIKANVTFWFKNTGSRFRHNGNVVKVNPYKQNNMAKELGISILDGKRLF
jgi:protein gp37